MRRQEVHLLPARTAVRPITIRGMPLGRSTWPRVLAALLRASVPLRLIRSGGRILKGGCDGHADGAHSKVRSHLALITVAEYCRPAD